MTIYANNPEKEDCFLCEFKPRKHCYRSYDGFEACELVGLFSLHQFSQFMDVKNIGLYRYDGLVSFVKCFAFTSLTKIFNKNNIKLNYSCTLNLMHPFASMQTQITLQKKTINKNDLVPLIKKFIQLTRIP